jgi:hypothetical protein
LKGRTFALPRDILPDVSFDVRDTSAIRDPSDPQDFMDSTGTVAGASFPIMSNSEVLGIITASVTNRPERLTESVDLKARLRGLAGQAGTALANAKLVDQIRRQALNGGLTRAPAIAAADIRRSLALLRWPQAWLRNFRQTWRPLAVTAPLSCSSYGPSLVPARSILRRRTSALRGRAQMWVRRTGSCLVGQRR